MSSSATSAAGGAAPCILRAVAGGKDRKALIAGINDLLDGSSKPATAPAAASASDSKSAPPLHRIGGVKRAGDELQLHLDKVPKCEGAGASALSDLAAAAALVPLPDSLPASAATSPAPPPAWDVFVSYDWGKRLPDGTFENQAKALRVVRALESKGLRVFFDVRVVASSAICANGLVQSTSSLHFSLLCPPMV